MALLMVAAPPLVYLAAATRPVLVANPALTQTMAQAPLPPEPPPPAVAPVPQAAPLPPAPAFPLPSKAAFAGIAPPAPLAAPAPLAPPPPFAHSGQQPEPPEAPEPPQVRDDGDWMINNSGYSGMTFAVVSGRSVYMNGSNDDAETVRALRSKSGSDFIWFRHDGNSYVIRDAATVKNALGLYAGMDELGRQQDELGRQQDELGRKQDAERERVLHEKLSNEVTTGQPSAMPAMTRCAVATALAPGARKIASEAAGAPLKRLKVSDDCAPSSTRATS